MSLLTELDVLPGAPQGLRREERQRRTSHLDRVQPLRRPHGETHERRGETMTRATRRASLIVALLLSTAFLFAGCTLPVHLGPLPAASDDAATLVIIRPAR